MSSPPQCGQPNRAIRACPICTIKPWSAAGSTVLPRAAEAAVAARSMGIAALSATGWSIGSADPAKARSSSSRLRWVRSSSPTPPRQAANATASMSAPAFPSPLTPHIIPINAIIANWNAGRHQIGRVAAIRSESLAALRWNPHDLNANWGMSMSNVPLSMPAVLAHFYLDWGTSGTLTSPTGNAGGNLGIETNPVTGSGLVYGGASSTLLTTSLFGNGFADTFSGFLAPNGF